MENKKSIESVESIGSVEGIKIVGQVELVFRDRYGKVLEIIKDDNLIVDVGKTRITAIIGTNISDYINIVALGDNGLTDAGSQKVPTADMTALYHEVVRKNIDTRVLYTTPIQVEFLTDIRSSLASDSDFDDPLNLVVNEVGLFTNDGICVALKTFKNISFDPLFDVVVSVRWKLLIL